jgi:hypothetical protein
VSKRIKTWQAAYKAVFFESDPKKQKDFCRKARLLMQQRLVALSDAKGTSREQAAIEAGLRKLWVLEQKTHEQSKKAKPSRKVDRRDGARLDSPTKKRRSDGKSGPHGS